jgi:hypothetical protein
MRILSLLPAATDMLVAMGLGDSLVGCTHECDLGANAERIPRVTYSRIPIGESSEEIDRLVREASESSPAWTDAPSQRGNSTERPSGCNGQGNQRDRRDHVLLAHAVANIWW